MCGISAAQKPSATHDDAPTFARLADMQVEVVLTILIFCDDKNRRATVRPPNASSSVAVDNVVEALNDSTLGAPVDVA